MPDKIEDIKDLGYTAEEVVEGLKKIAKGPDYDNKKVINEGPMLIDRFISFRNTDHDNPYNVPEIVKIEEIFCFMMAYRKPWRKSSRKSLKNYRNRLTKYCRGCTRFPSDCKKLIHVLVTTESFKQTHDTCRIRYLKEAMTREIRGPIITVRGGNINIEVK